jgi:hypothetical protein
MTQKVYREDEVLDALRELGGEASTDEIAKHAGIPGAGALVACGQLRGTKVEAVEERSRRGNPFWRIVDQERKGW